jgi:hypothetical protein
MQQRVALFLASRVAPRPCSRHVGTVEACLSSCVTVYHF